MSHSTAKKIRQEIRKTKYAIASDLKTWINTMGFKERFGLAMKIIFKRKW
jgi:hypothetical protein